MKLKILSTLLLIVALCGLFFLVKFTANIENPEENVKTGEVIFTEEETKEDDSTPSRTFVIKAAHDVESIIKRLAYESDKEYASSVSDLSLRLKQSSDYLKDTLNDFYGSAYFSKLSDIFGEVVNSPFADANDFSARVSGYLRDIDTSVPKESDTPDLEDEIYYPVINTNPDGDFVMSLISIYESQRNTSDKAVITLCGNLIIGDTLIGSETENSFKTSAEKSEFTYPLYKVSPVTCTDSVTFANLETPLTNSTEAIGVIGEVKGNPSYANLLTKGGIDFVTISSPRVLSYGEAGKTETKSALGNAGCNFSENAMISFFDTEIGRMALLTYDLVEESTKSNNGYIEPVKNDIAAARENGAVCVIVHFNWNNSSRDKWDPSLMQVYTVRGAIDNGADLVWATHPDCIEGIEKYKDAYIVYSLGNLADKTSPVSEAFIFRQEFLKGEDGNVIRSKASIFPISATNDGDGIPRLKVNSGEVDSFKNDLVNFSRTVRYGVNKKPEFTLDEFDIIRIEK